jgi:HTH-type transcriptional regulator/antitoxin MqsA
VSRFDSESILETMEGKVTIDEVLDRKAEVHLPPPAMRGEIRRAAGITQWDVAEVLGVSHRVVVARWEAGTRTPHGELRTRYAALLRRLLEETAAR